MKKNADFFTSFQPVFFYNKCFSIIFVVVNIVTSFLGLHKVFATRFLKPDIFSTHKVSKGKLATPRHKGFDEKASYLGFSEIFATRIIQTLQKDPQSLRKNISKSFRNTFLFGSLKPSVLTKGQCHKLSRTQYKKNTLTILWYCQTKVFDICW